MGLVHKISERPSGALVATRLSDQPPPMPGAPLNSQLLDYSLAPCSSAGSRRVQIIVLAGKNRGMGAPVRAPVTPGGGTAGFPSSANQRSRYMQLGIAVSE